MVMALNLWGMHGPEEEAAFVLSFDIYLPLFLWLTKDGNVVVFCFCTYIYLICMIVFSFYG